jgi:hypothetical protein
MLLKTWSLLKQTYCENSLISLFVLQSDSPRNPPDHQSWSEAFSGVEYVMHVASPNTLLFDDAKSDILDPAILGTQVMRSRQSIPLRFIDRSSSLPTIRDN